MNSISRLLIVLFLLLTSCQDAQPPVDCNCPEVEQPVVEEKKEVKFKPYSFLKKTYWSDIEYALSEDYLILAWPAWIRSCSTLINKKPWRKVCEQAYLIGSSPSNEEIINYYKNYFNLYQATNNDGTKEGLITGYYQPLLKGNWKKTKRYNIPLYSIPDDLITVNLSEIYPDLKYKRLRGRVEGNKLVPYFTRDEITEKATPLEGNELVWVNNAVEAFFLEIQGSGVIEFENGRRIQIGYADQNGHPYRSMGRALIRAGELQRGKVSMQSIKKWARNNKKKLRKFLSANPSYVFFRILPEGLPGPIGAMGIPITAERSVAIDRKYVPLGAPIFLKTTKPNTDIPIKQLMIAQDTGGAINGGVRADFYWGQGNNAGKMAGKMKQDGRIWVLLPKDFKLQ